MSDKATTLHVTISASANIPTPTYRVGKQEKRKRIESSQLDQSHSIINIPSQYTNLPSGPRYHNDQSTSTIQAPFIPYTAHGTTQVNPTPKPPPLNAYPQHPVSFPFPLHSANPSHALRSLAQNGPHPVTTIAFRPTTRPFVKSAKHFTSNKDRTIHELRQKLSARMTDLAAMQGRHEKDIATIKDQHRKEKESEVGMRIQAEYRAFVAEQQLGEANMRNALMEGNLSVGDERSRRQFADANARINQLSDQLRIATDRGKRWAQRAGEVEGKLGEMKIEVDKEKKRAGQTEDRLESILCETSTLGGTATTSLRQHLLSAKSELAKERLAVQELRRQLTQSTNELAVRATTILNLTSTIKQRDVDISTAQSRISELDRECESQLAELQTQLGMVSSLIAEAVAVQIANASQIVSQTELLVQLKDLRSMLAEVEDRAGWYKVEFKKAELEVIQQRGEAARQRQMADHFRSRALVTPRTNFDTKSKRSFPNQLYKPRWQIKREGAAVRVKSEESSVEGVEEILPLVEEAIAAEEINPAVVSGQELPLVEEVMAKEGIRIPIRSYQEQTPEERLVAAKLWARLLAGKLSVGTGPQVPIIGQGDVSSGLDAIVIDHEESMDDLSPSE